MKKGILLIGLIGLLLLTACGKKEVTDYIDVSFTGVESVGQVNYSVDIEKLFEDVFDYDATADFSDEEELEEMNAMATAYKVKVDPEKGLSNGDKVTITVAVNDKATKKIKNSEKKFTVEGLEESKDMTEYVTMSFEGLDSQGKAEYYVNEGELIADIFGQDGIDADTEEEVARLKSAYTVEVDQENLSNGDKVSLKVSVDEDKTKLIKGGEKEFTVSDLGEAMKLTEEDVKKHLVINFNGVSSKGVAQIDNTFSSPLDYVSFQIENDGELENGDEATLLMDEEMINQLNNSNYIVDEDFHPIFEVEGLDLVAEKATDISNLEDIERMIKEESTRKYEDMYVNDSYGTVYKINEEKVLYRQFDTGSNETTMYNQHIAANHGNLIGIYTIEKHSGGTDPELQQEFTAVIGFGGMIIDDKGKVNVSEGEFFHDERDESYSKESVIQLYEGYGYTEVKK